MELPNSIDNEWQIISDLTIFDAAYWMKMGHDPIEHHNQCQNDEDFYTYFYEHPGGESAVFEASEIIKSACRAGYIKVTKDNKVGDDFDINKTYILKSDWINWCRDNNYSDLAKLFLQKQSLDEKSPVNLDVSKVITLEKSENHNESNIREKANKQVVMKNKLRRNLLDPVIDLAIKQAGSHELADVYLKLKDLALNGTSPFSGAVDGNALFYTNGDNDPEKFTKNALSKRLKRRKE